MSSFCPYQSNSFCASLDEETRLALCSHCQFRHFLRGEHPMYQYWNTVVLLVDGLLLSHHPDSQIQGRYATNGLASSGDLVCTTTILHEANHPSISDEVVCLHACTFACFDSDYIQALFDTNIPFIKSVYNSALRFCGSERIEMLHEIGCKDAYAAVRYVVKYCHERQLELPTHERIGQICNRSRQTVTAVMGKLTQNEPELFQR